MLPAIRPKRDGVNIANLEPIDLNLFEEDETEGSDLKEIISEN